MINASHELWAVDQHSHRRSLPKVAGANLVALSMFLPLGEADLGASGAEELHLVELCHLGLCLLCCPAVGNCFT